MPKHTPGPWEIREGEDYHEILMGTARDHSGSYQPQHSIEYQHGLYEEDGDQYEEAEANARLIAAAPDLLEACAAMLCTWGSDDEDAIIEARDKARAAITKATGGTPT